MKTYLLFFGKAQDFVLHAFEEAGYVRDFDAVIRDFDLLESNVFTVDGTDNEAILAKYHFTAFNGKTYSLLKLYGFGQAFDGTRVAGSIYGVAFLSELDICLSGENIKMLHALKEGFAQMCLRGVKFIMSDFRAEVGRIAAAFAEQDCFSQIGMEGIPQVAAASVFPGIWVKDLLKDPVGLDKEMKHTSRLYFSTDLPHLKRTMHKMDTVFRVYRKQGNTIALYKEEAKAKSKQQTINDSFINGQMGDIIPVGEIDRLKKVHERKVAKLVWQLRWAASGLAAMVVVCVLILLPARTRQETAAAAAAEPVTNAAGSLRNGPLQRETNPVAPPERLPVATQSIRSMLEDEEKLDMLFKLCKNIRQYKEEASANYYNAIVRDAKALNVDITFLKQPVIADDKKVKDKP